MRFSPGMLGTEELVYACDTRPFLLCEEAGWPDYN